MALGTRVHTPGHRGGDRTEAESGWYGHCMQVLGWFLAYNGIDEERAQQIAETAAGGRFDSWVAPAVTVVDEVS